MRHPTPASIGDSRALTASTHRRRLRIVSSAALFALTGLAAKGQLLYQDNFNRANSTNNLGTAQDALGAPLSWSLQRDGTNSGGPFDTITTGSPVPVSPDVNIANNKLLVNTAGNGPGPALNNVDMASFYVDYNLDTAKSYSTTFNFTHLNGTPYDAAQVGSQRNGGFFIMPRAQGNDFPGNTGWVIRRTADGQGTLSISFDNGVGRSGSPASIPLASLGTDLGNTNGLLLDAIHSIRVDVYGPTGNLGRLTINGVVIDQNRDLGANFNNGTPDRVLMGYNTVGTAGRRGISTIDDLVVSVPSAWNVSGSGNWPTAGNWTANGAPNAIDAVANFGSIISGASTVTLNAAQTVGAINFDSSNKYTIAGSSTLTVDVTSGVAGINTTQGNHEISAPLTLNDDLRITTQDSTGVSISGAITATGRTITKAGQGTTQFGSFQAAAMNVIGGSVNFAATPANSLNVNIGTLTVGQLTNIGDQVTGNVTFDSGSVTLSALQLASRVQVAAATGSQATFTVGGSSVNLGSTAVLTVTGQTSLARRTLTTGNGAEGSLVINGGTVNLLGGVVDSSTAGTRTTNLVFNAGTLNMGGTAIGTAAAPITNVNLSSGGQSTNLLNLGGTGINGAGLTASAGGGTLIVRAGSTYTGPTLASNGTISLRAIPTNSSLFGARDGSLDVSQLATTFGPTQPLGGSGNIFGNATAASLSPGEPTNPAATMTLNNNLTLSGGGTLTFELSDSAGGNNDRANINGSLVLNGTTILKPVKLGANFDTGSQYTLMNFASRSGAGTIQTASQHTRRIFTPTLTATQLLLTVGGSDPVSLTWNGNGTTNNWNFTEQNFKNGAANDFFFDDDAVTFNDAGSNSPNVNLQGELRPGSITVNPTTKDYTFTGNGSLTTNSLTVGGGRTLSFTNTGSNGLGTVQINGSTVSLANSGSNTMADVNVQSGSRLLLVNGGSNTANNFNVDGSSTLQVGAGTSGGAISGAISADGTVIFNTTTDITIGTFNGNGTVLKNNTNIVDVQTGGGGLGGGWTINGGAVVGRGVNALGSGSIVVNNASTLVFGANHNNAVNMTNGGTLGAAADLTLAGEMTFTTGTTTNATLFDATNPGTTSGNMQFTGLIHGGGTIIVSANPSLVAAGTYNVDGADAFRSNNTGSDFSGNIIVGPGGKLDVSAAGDLVTSIGTGKIFMTAGTFTPGTQSGNFTMLIARGAANATFGNNVEVLPGTGSFITLNSPTVNATALWGNLRVGSMTVGVNKNTASASPNTVGFTSVTLTGGATGPTVFAPTTPLYGSTGGGTANMAIANIGEAVAGSSIVMNGFTSLFLTGSNTYTGTTTVSNGSLILGNGANGTSIASTAAFTNNATVAFNSDSTITLAGSITGTGTMLHNGTGSSSVAGRIAGSALFVNAGQLKIAAKGSPNNAGGTSVVKALSIAPGAQLDLTNNAAIVDYTGAVGTLVEDTRAMLADGRLTSSTAPANQGLGYADNNVLKKTGTFAGQPLDADFTDLLVLYTYRGDANLDGKVNALDFNAVATNFGSGSVWSQGDFNYDSTVTTADFMAMANNFGLALASPALGSLVPEPGSLVCVRALLFGRRRRN